LRLQVRDYQKKTKGKYIVSQSRGVNKSRLEWKNLQTKDATLIQAKKDIEHLYVWLDGMHKRLEQLCK